MNSPFYAAEHEAFRQVMRRFVEKEIEPYAHEWDEAGEFPRALYAKAASVQGLWLTYLSGKRELMNEAWKQLSQWIADGRLHPVVGHVFPAEQVPEAYRLLGERKNFGKVVLKIA